jgi:hypothetical protein
VWTFLKTLPVVYSSWYVESDPNVCCALHDNAELWPARESESAGNIKLPEPLPSSAVML